MIQHSDSASARHFRNWRMHFHFDDYLFRAIRHLKLLKNIKFIIRVPTEFWNWGYNCCFFLNFVPLHIESPYNFGGKKPSAEGKWAFWSLVSESDMFMTHAN